MSEFNIIEITPENVSKHGLFCIKDSKNPGFGSKLKWYTERYKEGLRVHILKNAEGKAAGFIEYVPAELAWRPLQAPNFMFIHCTMINSKKNQGKGYASRLLEICMNAAKAKGMAGLCVMTSKGSWVASKSLFERNGFVQVDQKGRFELMAKKWDAKAPNPQLIDWTLSQKDYQGWHLVYADQCPYHAKAIVALTETAKEFGVQLQVRKLQTAGEAKMAPSGFGVFSLLKDGKLLEDHYISATRFKNILKKELP